MYKYFILIFLSLALLLFFKFYYIRLTNLLKLYDIPDFKRKIHNKKVLQFIYNYSKYKIALTVMAKTKRMR
jgi:hypothetical protein